MRRVGVLAAGIAALAVAWLVSPPGAPPLYDGVAVAPPYLFYCNPPGSQSTAAAGRRETDPLQSGQSPPLAFVTGEPGVPQVQVLVGAGAIVVPTGATDVAIEADPIVPPAILPSDGQIDGNAYQISVTAGGQPAPLAPGQVATIVLRGRQGGGTTQVIERFDGHAWTRLTTQPVGQADIFGGNTSAVGIFALVTPGPAATPQPCATPPPTATTGTSSGSGTVGAGGDQGSGGAITVAAIVIAVALVGGGGLLLLLRRGPATATPRRRPPGGQRRPPSGRR